MFWPTVRKKLFQWSRKTFEIRGWRPRICKISEITRTIYSNSERSEQFLVTECFFNFCSWRFLISNKLEQLEFKLEKLLGFRNMQEKLENMYLGIMFAERNALNQFGRNRSIHISRENSDSCLKNRKWFPSLDMMISAHCE